MLISEKYKYIYIANPKTASRSIRAFLQKHDPSAKKYHAVIDGIEYNFASHPTAAEIREMLGDKYENYTTFGFIRNPYSKLVSSYYFYQQSDILKGRPLAQIKVYLSRILPFKIWSLVYPYKSNMDYFVHNEEIIVNHIVRFENLQQDFERIVKGIGMELPTYDLPVRNTSQHDRHSAYIQGGIFKALIRLKLRRDLNFYNMTT